MLFGSLTHSLSLSVSLCVSVSLSLCLSVFVCVQLLLLRRPSEPLNDSRRSSGGRGAHDASEDACASACEEDLSQVLQAIRFFRRRQCDLADAAAAPADSRIQRIQSGHRLLAQGGMTLHVRANGETGAAQTLHFNLREAARTNDASVMFAMLLQECTRLLASPLPFKRMFLDKGTEIRRFADLTPDATVCVSTGEAFIPTDEVVLHVAFDGLDTIVVGGERALMLGGAAVDMRMVSTGAITPYTSLPAALACDDLHWRKHPPVDGTALVSDPSLVALHVKPSDGGEEALLRPMLTCGAKNDVGASLQRWIVRRVEPATIATRDDIDLTKAWAEISCRAFPKLCLSCACDTVTVDGQKRKRFRPTFAPRTHQPLASALWHFAPDGTIRPALHDGLVLTTTNSSSSSSDTGDYVEQLSATSSSQEASSEEATEHSKQLAEAQAANSHGNSHSSLDDTIDSSGGEEAMSGARLVLRPRVRRSRRQRQRQQWGLKRDDTLHMGDWKVCRGVNSSHQWAKRCMLWPTATTGSWNSELLFPLEVLLVPGVAWKLPAKKEKQSLRESMELMRGGGAASVRDAVMTVPRLRVVRNGVRMKPVDVLVPQGLRARDDRPTPNVQRAFAVDTQKWLEQRLGPAWRTVVTSRENSRSAARMRELQLDMFLDKCTRALEMSVPARALFTEQGTAVRDLEQLQPNQVVIVTGPEAWCPPASVLNRLPNLERDISALQAVSEAFSNQTRVAAVFDEESEQLLLRDRAALEADVRAGAAKAVGSDGDAAAAARTADASNEGHQTSSSASDGKHGLWLLTEERHLVSATNPSLCLAPET